MDSRVIGEAEEWPFGPVSLSQNQAAEAAGIARIIRTLVDQGTPPEEVLILAKSDPSGRLSGPVVEALTGVGLETYLPRGAALSGDSIERLLEYLALSSELDTQDRVDDLALRALLELEDNDIGAARIAAVRNLALARTVRFTAAVEYIRANPTEFTANRLGTVVETADQIVSTARGLAQREGEGFAEWIARISGDLDLPDEARVLVAEIVAQIEAERLDEQPAPADPAEAVRDFVADLAGGMTRLGETLPAREPGKITLTTMHGAKGLSADVVVVLQAEDQVIPGETTEVMEIDEARRLLYVSLTRARKHLLVSACVRRTGRQRFVGQLEVVDRDLTRFLRDYGLEGHTVEQVLAAIT